MPYTGDTLLHYRETGDGKPVVFLHGAAGSGQLFSAQFQAFRDIVKCYFLDLPGHGKSPAISGGSVADYADVVIRFLEEIGRPAAMVGHSMGGAIALEVALRAKVPLLGLVLVGTGCRLPVSEKVLRGLETDFEATLSTVVRYCFSKAVLEELLERAVSEAQKTDPAIVRRDFQACNTFDCCERLAEIRIPAFVICGEKDVMVPPPASELLASSIPGARLEIIPRGSHSVMLEQPGAFNDLVFRFLRNL